MSRICKSTELESSLVVVGAGEGVERDCWCGQGVSFRGDERVLDLTMVLAVQLCQCTKSAELCNLNWWIISHTNSTAIKLLERNPWTSESRSVFLADFCWRAFLIAALTSAPTACFSLPGRPGHTAPTPRPFFVLTIFQELVKSCPSPRAFPDDQFALSPFFPEFLQHTTLLLESRGLPALFAGCLWVPRLPD